MCRPFDRCRSGSAPSAPVTTPLRTDGRTTYGGNTALCTTCAVCGNNFAIIGNASPIDRSGWFTVDDAVATVRIRALFYWQNLSWAVLRLNCSLSVTQTRCWTCFLLSRSTISPTRRNWLQPRKPQPPRQHSKYVRTFVTLHLFFSF